VRSKSAKSLDKFIEYTDFAIQFFALVYFIEGLPSYVKRLKAMWNYKIQRETLYSNLRALATPMVFATEPTTTAATVKPPSTATSDNEPVEITLEPSAITSTVSEQSQQVVPVQNQAKKQLVPRIIPLYNGQVLPEELLEQVLLYLDGAFISAKCARVCKHWYKFCNREYMWRQFLDIMINAPEAYTAIYTDLKEQKERNQPKTPKSDTTGMATYVTTSAVFAKPKPSNRYNAARFVGIQNPNFIGATLVKKSADEEENEAQLEADQMSIVKKREDARMFRTFDGQLEAVRNPALRSKQEFVERFSYSNFRKLCTYSMFGLSQHCINN